MFIVTTISRQEEARRGKHSKSQAHRMHSNKSNSKGRRSNGIRLADRPPAHRRRKEGLSLTEGFVHRTLVRKILSTSIAFVKSLPSSVGITSNHFQPMTRCKKNECHYHVLAFSRTLSIPLFFLLCNVSVNTVAVMDDRENKGVDSRFMVFHAQDTCTCTRNVITS